MRNVALIVLDSVRKDVFDEVSTRLRAKADVEYEQCRAPALGVFRVMRAY